MPLLPGKKNVGHNIKTEMAAGKPQKQSIAIALNVARKNKPKKMAAGGKLDTEAREHIKDSNFALPGRRYPIHDISHARNALARVSQHGTPEEKAKVHAAVHRKYPSLAGPKKMDDGGDVSSSSDTSSSPDTSGSGAGVDESQLDSGNQKTSQAQGMAAMRGAFGNKNGTKPEGYMSGGKIDGKHRVRKMKSGGPVEIDFDSEGRSNADNARTPEDEEMLEGVQPKTSRGPIETDFSTEGRPTADDITEEELDMIHQHRMASGGPVEVDFVSEGMTDVDEAATPEDENMLHGKGHPGKNPMDITANEEHMTNIDEAGDDEDLDMTRQKLARGGEAGNPKLQQSHMEPDEEDGEQPKDLADAVMMKRKRKKMAVGGMASIDPDSHTDESDVSRNADEDANMEDQSSYNSLRKENYSDSDGLHEIDKASKMDSGQHGDDSERAEEDEHDMVSQIRKKIRSRI